MAKPWTQEEIDFLKANYGKMRPGEIAEALGRSRPSVMGKAGQLGLRKKKRPRWTKEELQYLENAWGQVKLSTIARKLGRTETAVLVKAKRMGLGASRNATGKITAKQLADTLGIDVKAITEYWIPKLGLKYCHKITRSKRRFYLIDIDDFWEWAERNQDKFDTRRFEEGILGKEPPWMKQKRKSDHKLPVRRLQKWTPVEDELLKAMFRAGHLTYREMGERLGRSEAAVGHRLQRIDIWESKGA